MMSIRPLARSRAAALAILPPLVAGCGSSNILHEYDYRGSTLAVVSELPRAPDVLSGPWLLGRSSGDPVRDLVRIGARVAREVQAGEVRERLDSAVARVDVGYEMEDAVLERAARYLGARPTWDEDEPADFLLELVVVEYGIDADTWDAAAHVFIEADATLLHVESGEEIWRKEIGARDPLGPSVFGPRSTVRDVVTAATLASLDVEEIVAALEYLADFSARVITDELRDDLRDARRR